MGAMGLPGQAVNQVQPRQKHGQAAWASMSARLVDVRDRPHQHLRRAGQRVGLDHLRVETLHAHRRAVTLGAVLGDQTCDGCTTAGGHRQRIGVVDVQYFEVRTGLADSGQQPVDRVRVPVQVEEKKQVC